MQAKELYYRVDRRPEGQPDNVRDEINPWKVGGWVAIVFAAFLLGIYLFHLGHTHEPVLPWKTLTLLGGGGLVVGGLLIRRGDDVADWVERWFQSRTRGG